MKTPMSRLVSSLSALARAAVFAGPAVAADHEVKMLNRGAAGMMVFEPAWLKVEPGDTVTFKAVNPSLNAESIVGMIPDGAEPFNCPISKYFTVTLFYEGLYSYHFLPHSVIVLVGLILFRYRSANSSSPFSFLPPFYPLSF